MKRSKTQQNFNLGFERFGSWNAQKRNKILTSDLSVLAHETLKNALSEKTPDLSVLAHETLKSATEKRPRIWAFWLMKRSKNALSEKTPDLSVLAHETLKSATEKRPRNWAFWLMKRSKTH